MMSKDDGYSMLGAYQEQIDTRFIYDVDNKELIFYPENCSNYNPS